MDTYDPFSQWKYAKINFKGTLSIQIPKFVTPSLLFWHLYHNETTCEYPSKLSYFQLSSVPETQS